PLTGILKCGYCHHNLTRASVKQPYYHCYMAKYEESTPCSIIKVMEKAFSDILLTIINKQVSMVLRDGRNPSEFTLTNHERIQSLQKQIQLKQQEIEKLRVSRKNAFEEYCFEHISKEQYAAMLETNAQQMNQISEKLRELQTECSLLTEDKQETEYQQVHQKYEFADQLTKDMVLAFVKEIFVFEGERFEIVWNYEDYYKMSGLL
ncbi:MAG: zinc ribbon domain-containing protein, partial [Oscillospiraceae bacterium]